MSDLLTRLFSEESPTAAAALSCGFFGGQEETKGKIVGSLYGMLTFEPVPDTKNYGHQQGRRGL